MKIQGVFSMSILAAVLASSSFADPVVGMSATYQCINSGRVMTQKAEITAVKADGTFETLSTVSYSGQIVTNSSTSSIATYSEAQAFAKSIDSRCGDATTPGGVLELLNVPAGTFKTCRLTSGDGSTYSIGNVPFQLLQMKQGTTTCVLKEYKKY